MDNIKTSQKSLLQYFDFRYFIRFLLLLLAFYFANRLFMEIGRPQGRLYSPFLRDNLHYVGWIRESILYVANLITHAFGFDTYMVDGKILKVVDGRSVIMARQCVGLEIMGFWMAFVLAHSCGLWRKVSWTVAGLFAICMINATRVAVLLIALEKDWQVITNIEIRHTMFNIAAYACIVVMIYFFYRQTKKTVKVGSAEA
jgi:exosortase/archaeosortase family protein